ncbi:MAG: DNA topoisomerase III [Oceanospirillaceae bacterium]|uniref:DNA topoisomerase III n=1 Tax=unclassified Thalassolituus TaxID=2624967 RepID=UPI000C45ABED|nr:MULTISPECIES: DNA topoisomerase III [unclassified Thalassolituus]MAS25308.1 DNA topoisomerase III [Oceanospirillaceae bacterium]MBL33285.1 DNA topoisomerase III [Oceanospirillaceae bacterium]MBS54363.1 DNA topoisomerase III [Oceanospirillaceae bacterium]|tara:strand:+ start:7002 stop:9041 length:2040 start_codon:yes stop_codon:yes gene_type:complete
MRLFIAEKPSLGRAIAAVLPKPHSKGDGFIRAANGDVVSWCIGHLLEQAEPEAYNPSYKSWRLDVLPIIPDEWQLQPKAKTRKQLSVLRKLVKEADQLVHAGDPDREGQLLVDEVIAYLKVPAAKRNQTQRLLISDLNPQAVSRALQQLKANSEFIPLSVSALARSRADWLYGINLTRACTIKGRQGGLTSVLSVGRVQTPVLGLVVRRDNEIADFISRLFYEVRAAVHLSAESPLAFYAKWQPSEACAAHQDEDGRVLNPKLAENVAGRIRQQPAQVDDVERKQKQQNAPLPYNLSSLQIEAGKAFGLSAKQVLDACQNLYEKHQLITYPRSDCRYLPNDHYSRRQQVVNAIGNNDEKLSGVITSADLSLRSKAWNDSKVEAHHAIIPTEKGSGFSSLSLTEKQLYGMIARQYLLQFYPPFIYADSKVTLTIAGGVFTASEREVIQPGWKQALVKSARNDGGAGEREADDGKKLPVLNKGQTLWSGEPEIDEKHTQPPAPFTDATLLAAMTGINRFVKNNELKKVLKDTDGLGTEATRASIIELLFKRRFLHREGKNIRATDLGKAFIKSLPEETSVPDMTAHWERQLNDISERALKYDDFMQPMLTSLHGLVNTTSQLDTQAFHGINTPAPSFRRKRSSGSGARSATKTATKTGSKTTRKTARKTSAKSRSRKPASA